MKALKKSISIFCAISMILGMLAGNLVTAEKVSQSMAGNVSCWWAGGSFAENRRSEYSVSSRWAYDSASDSYTRSGADTGWHDHNVAMLFGGSSYEEFIFEFDLALSEQKFNEDGTKNSAPAVWLQFGADPAEAPQDTVDAGGEYIYLAASYDIDDEIFSAVSCFYNADTPDGQWGGTVSDFNAATVHHVKLSVLGGRRSLSVDGRVLYDQPTVSGYTGGYVGVGTGWQNTVISNARLYGNDPDVLFDGWSAYSSDSQNTFYVQDAAAAGTVGDNWQQCSENMISPKSSSVMNILYSDRIYTEFEMEFDYISDVDTLYVGFGAQQTGGEIMTQGQLSDPSPAVIRITRSGQGAFADPNAADGIGWFPNTGGTLFTTPEQQKAVHTAKITVTGNQITLTLDGKTRGSINIQNYDGGYVFLMSRSENDAFSCPVFLDTDVNSMFADYTSYEAETNDGATFWQTGLAKQDKVSENWQYKSDGRIAPKTGSTTSFLFTNKTYTDFEMTFDFTSQKNVYIGFGSDEPGAVLQKGAVSDPSPYVIRLNNNGLHHFAPSDDSGSSSIPYNNEKWNMVNNDSSIVYNCKIVVNDGWMSLYINGIMSDHLQELPHYEGGYIYIQSGYSSESISLPEIREIGLDSSFNENFTAYRSNSFSTVEIDEGITTSTKTSPYWASGLAPDGDPSANWYKGADGMYTKSRSGIMSTLYLDGIYDQNFRISFDYAVPNANGNYGLFVGIGNETPGDDWFRAEDSRTANIIRLQRVAGAGFSPDEADLLSDTWVIGGFEISEWDSSKAHSAVIEVMYDTVYMYLDGVYIGSAPLVNYEAGGIFLAAETFGVKFTQPVIESISPAKYGDEQSTAYGKSALFIGDSICDGAGDLAAWAGRLGWHFDLDYTNIAQGGWIIADDAATGLSSIQTQLTDQRCYEYDYIIVEGGINDIMQNVNINSEYCKLGEISASYNIEDFDTTTAAGGLEAIFYNATYIYGNDTKIGFIMTPKPSDNWIEDWVTAEKYVDTYLAICEKWNVEVLNLWDDEAVETAFSGNSGLYTDGLHPSYKGYDYLDASVAGWFEGLESTGYAGRGHINSDGEIDIRDLICMKKLLSESEPDYLYSADLNSDGSFNSIDLLEMRKYLLKII